MKAIFKTLVLTAHPDDLELSCGGTIKKIVDDYQSDLIIFSELMLTGYPPEDLILKPAFMEKCEDAISELKLYL